jgi:hypothetical protein
MSDAPTIADTLTHPTITKQRSVSQTHEKVAGDGLPRQQGNPQAGSRHAVPLAEQSLHSAGQATITISGGIYADFSTIPYPIAGQLVTAHWSQESQ